MANPLRIVVTMIVAMVLMGVTAGAQRQGERSDAPAAGRGTERAKPRTPTAAQRANMERRIETAMAIVVRFEAEAKASGRAAAWRQVTLDTLLSLPMGALRRVEQEAVSADSIAAIAAEAAEDPRLLGDPRADLVYTPITPCRFSDTRVVAGKLAGKRGYSLGNSGSVYGGAIPSSPELLFGADEDAFGAIAINVTIVDPSAAPGFVGVKNHSDSPLTSWVNW